MRSCTGGTTPTQDFHPSAARSSCPVACCANMGVISARLATRPERRDMKKKASNRNLRTERDTKRPEYDFSKAVRGVTAARYAQGANIAVIDPEVLDVFPDSATVNQTLRALAPVLRQQRRVATKRRNASCDS